MEDFEQRLCRAINICEGDFSLRKHLISTIYSFTTENISGYLKFFDLKNKSLLTVGSSGDQILNAYFFGARDITLIDINEYAKFYIYLKISAIISLNHKEFQEFFFIHDIKSNYNKNVFSKELFNKIKSTLRILDYESYLFFDELFSLFQPKIIRNRLIEDDEKRVKTITNFNTYLKNEENYNILKNKIHSITFKYINEDIYKTNLNHTYDNIFLSNLCGFVSIEKTKELVKKLDNNNLNINGKMLIAYLYEIKFNENNYMDNWSSIYKMPITRKLLQKYITEYHQITGGRSFFFNDSNQEDLVLIYKKHK